MKIIFIIKWKFVCVPVDNHGMLNPCIQNVVGHASSSSRAWTILSLIIAISQYQFYFHILFYYYFYLYLYQWETTSRYSPKPKTSNRYFYQNEKKKKKKYVKIFNSYPLFTIAIIKICFNKWSTANNFISNYPQQKSTKNNKTFIELFNYVFNKISHKCILLIWCYIYSKYYSLIYQRHITAS